MGSATYRTGLPLRRIPAGSAEGFSWVNKHAGSLFDLGAGHDLRDRAVAGRSRRRFAGHDVERDDASRADHPRQRAHGRGDDVELQLGAVGRDARRRAGAGVGHVSRLHGAAQRHRADADRDQVADAGRRDHQRRGPPGRPLRTSGWTTSRSASVSVLDDSQGIVVRGCTITTPGSGIDRATATGPATRTSATTSSPARPRTGPTRRWAPRVTTWARASSSPAPGNVICYNFVQRLPRLHLDDGRRRGRRPAIDRHLRQRPRSSALDDGIEADFTDGQRAHHAQPHDQLLRRHQRPADAGRTDVFDPQRDVQRHLQPVQACTAARSATSRFTTRWSSAATRWAIYAGATWSRALFRNNIFIGGTGGGTYGGYGNGSGLIAQMRDADATCSFDYDGFGSIGISNFRGQIGGASFSSLATLQSATTEKNAVQVDMSVLRGVGHASVEPVPDAAGGRPAAGGWLGRGRQGRRAAGDQRWLCGRGA